MKRKSTPQVSIIAAVETELMRRPFSSSSTDGMNHLLTAFLYIQVPMKMVMTA